MHQIGLYGFERRILKIFCVLIEWCIDKPHITCKGVSSSIYTVARVWLSVPTSITSGYSIKTTERIELFLAQAAVGLSYIVEFWYRQKGYFFVKLSQSLRVCILRKISSRHGDHRKCCQLSSPDRQPSSALSVYLPLCTTLWAWCSTSRGFVCDNWDS